jgi:hypothetical protein
MEKGLIKWKNGDFYKGHVVDGMYTGFGVLSTKAFTYEGTL